MERKFDGIIDATDVVMQRINEGAPFRIVGQPLTYTPNSIVVDRSDDALAATLREIIEAMHKDGTLTRLSMKWFDVDLTQVLISASRIRAASRHPANARAHTMREQACTRRKL